MPYTLIQGNYVGMVTAGADPGFLDRGFKLADGVRFVQFDHFFF